MAVKRFLSRSVFLVLVVGGVLGVVAMLAAEEADRLTSTDAFCTSCHSMTYVADDPYYRTSTHRLSPSGVQAGCADCHIPPGLVAATWAHAKGGIKDIWVETTTDFSDPAAWQARRGRLAGAVRAWMTENDSATCRRCHDSEATIRPESPKGLREHDRALQDGTTCVACHENLVHSPHRP